MKYGAQLFSLRDQCQTPEEIRNTFSRCAKMGYQVVQASGMGPIDPYELRDISQEFSLPITITHTAPKRLEEELDRVIEEHRIFGCPVIGLGAMPKIYRDGLVSTWKDFYNKFDPIARRIREAGLDFAYHNHAFEFKPLDDGKLLYEHILEETDWSLIADVCWMEIGGVVPAEWFPRLKGRIRNAHAKDARSYEGTEKDFCPLGQGKTDLPSALRAMEENGCEFCHVEQDNATKKPDPFGEMAASAAWLKEKKYL